MKKLFYLCLVTTVSIFHINTLYANIELEKSSRKFKNTVKNTVDEKSNASDLNIPETITYFDKKESSPGFNLTGKDNAINKYVNSKSNTDSKNVFNTENVSRKKLKGNIFLNKKTLGINGGEPEGEKKIDGFSLTGMITGIVGLVFSPIGLVFGPIAMAFSLIGLLRKLSKPDRHSGLGFAITGLACGFLGFVVGILFLLILL